MRFVFAIVAFALAAVMIVLGLAQRTVFLGPESTALSASVEGTAAYTVIAPDALAAFSGRQTVTVSGDGPVFLAYGRSADIDAWVGQDAHTDIGAADGELTVTPTAAAGAADTTDTDAEPASTVTDPAGSDLWLEEFTGEGELVASLNVPAGISVIVASDGTAPAPGEVSMSWRVDNSTPWAGPLIVGGAALMALGLVLYLLALLHLRRSQRPRRNLARGPRMPRLPRAPRPKMIKAGDITGSSSSTKRFVAVIPVVLVSGLVLSGCTAEFWPGGGSAPAPAGGSLAVSATPTETPTPVAATTADDSDIAAGDPTSVAAAAVTVSQLEQIVARISAVAAEADANLDADAIATRFAGPALEQRLANYTVRATAPDVAAVTAMPAAPLTLTLPQQSDSWPRVVMTIIQDAANPTIAPTAVVLRQVSPRSDYLVEYSLQLEPEARVPDVAPATIGAPMISPDSKLLLMPPDQLAAAYSDVLLRGEASESFDLFESSAEGFLSQVAAGKAAKVADLPVTASIEFTAEEGSGRTLAMATNDSGSVVAVSLNEIETVKPIDDQATVSPDESAAASKALSGITSTAKGIQSTYADQLLFYVPAAGSTDKISLLGFSQGLISSSELP
ncbi:MAG: hypothetical protein R6W83_12540 [Cryobacterium sp.]